MDVNIPDEIRAYTVVDTQRLTNLAGLASLVPPGAIVECGTARGGSAAVMAAYSTDLVWLYDTFEGLPKPTARDGERAWDYVGANKATVSDVDEAMRIMNVPLSRYRMYIGNFAWTFESIGPTQIALLHVDADWYESVLLSLRRWYPAVVDGGAIVLDDFGFWPGCRAAFYDFVCENRLTPDLRRCGEAAWWVKGTNEKIDEALNG